MVTHWTEIGQFYALSWSRALISMVARVDFNAFTTIIYFYSPDTTATAAYALRVR
jgi:hypothetical protein